MFDLDRLKPLLALVTAEAIQVMRHHLRHAPPAARLKMAMDILKIQGKKASVALTGTGDVTDEAMARDLAEWILVTARADPAAYAQLRHLYEAVRSRRGRGKQPTVQ